MRRSSGVSRSSFRARPTSGTCPTGRCRAPTTGTASSPSPRRPRLGDLLQDREAGRPDQGRVSPAANADRRDPVPIPRSAAASGIAARCGRWCGVASLSSPPRLTPCVRRTREAQGGPSRCRSRAARAGEIEAAGRVPVRRAAPAALVRAAGWGHGRRKGGLSDLHLGARASTAVGSARASASTWLSAHRWVRRAGKEDSLYSRWRTPSDPTRPGGASSDRGRNP